MWSRVPLSILAVCLLIVSVGTLVVQAQTQSFRERNLVWESRAVVQLPGDDEEDDEEDDEGDDEGCDDPYPPAPVPATGQITCIGSHGYQDSCEGSGLDAETRMGVTVVPRFATHSDGTITDGLTGLIWLQQADCFGARAFRDALSDVWALADGACELTDGSEPGDWRLPNVKELQSLIDYGRYDPPALPPDQPFSGVQPGRYWTSSVIIGGNPSTDAWAVDMSLGSVEPIDVDSFAHVLPVRGGVLPEHSVCDGSITLCDCPPPDCPEGEMPSVIDLCWGPCVSISECLPF